jgi:hypothetical protein
MRGNIPPRVRFLFEVFGQTLRTLWAHKLRSFLTVFGIARGGGSPGTPTGNYPIVITAATSDGAVSHTASFTFAVQ